MRKLQRLVSLTLVSLPMICVAFFATGCGDTNTRLAKSYVDFMFYDSDKPEYVTHSLIEDSEERRVLQVVVDYDRMNRGTPVRMREHHKVEFEKNEDSGSWEIANQTIESSAPSPEP